MSEVSDRPPGRDVRLARTVDQPPGFGRNRPVGGTLISKLINFVLASWTITSHGHHLPPPGGGSASVEPEASRKGRNTIICLGIILAFLAALLISGSLRLGVTVEVGNQGKAVPGVNGK